MTTMPMIRKIEVEICCASLADCIVAAEAGADAIELVSAHLLGGLTPSAGLLSLVKERVPLRVSAMVRPRGAGFCYSEEDFQVMCEDARRFVQQGADGIVFGFLTADGALDYERCARFVECCGDKQTVFHRAIDVTADPCAVVEKLVSLGVTRVLTSGGASGAPEGAPVIRALQQEYGSKIQILAGAGVRAANVLSLVRATGVERVHLGGTSFVQDRSTLRNPALDFGAALPEDHSVFPAVDRPTIQAVMEALRQEN